jgi:hypothetical protein
MRLALVPSVIALLALSSPGPSASATLHLLGFEGGASRLYAVDTATGIVTPAAALGWQARAANLAVLDGRLYGVTLGDPCAGGDAKYLDSYDLKSGEAGGSVPLAVVGGPARFNEMGGIASDGSRLLVSFAPLGTDQCANTNVIGEVSTSGVVSVLHVYPTSTDLSRLVFTADGRLLALPTPASGLTRSLYQIDLATWTPTLLGTHATSWSGGEYWDVAFADGELWALERLASGQRLRRIDPNDGSLLGEISLAGSTTLQFRGLTTLAGTPTPAAPASWGKVKSVYR